jgi:predicted nuclease of predicted toxin-antitoxin system
MRLLANENIPAPLIAALRELGYDVASVLEASPGLEDPQILASAVAESRILLTCDTDFGELAFRHRLPAQSGVILLRLPTDSLDTFIRAAVAAIQSRSDWSNLFSVVEPGRVRMTTLPGSPH